ncbi:hypothetical protein I552_10055 [Mycobacterium xenopi 3993]|nr:hypothetical protein I552_10055 [Mycobacterium xenopi 3993]
MAAAAQRLTPVLLELGGNDPRSSRPISTSPTSWSTSW